MGDISVGFQSENRSSSARSTRAISYSAPFITSYRCGLPSKVSRLCFCKRSSSVLLDIKFFSPPCSRPHRGAPTFRRAGRVIKSMVRRCVSALNKQASSSLPALGLEIVSVCPYVTVVLIKRSPNRPPSVTSLRRSRSFKRDAAFGSRGHRFLTFSPGCFQTLSKQKLPASNKHRFESKVKTPDEGKRPCSCCLDGLANTLTARQPLVLRV